MNSVRPPDEPPGPHAPGAAGYVIAWGALVVLATVTLVASRAAGGGWGLVIAFAIATAKAGVVAAVFMDLSGDLVGRHAGGRPIHRVVLAVAVGFVLVLVLGVLADVGTRSVASPYVDDLGQPAP